MRLRSLLSLFSHDLAIDLGTANTLVYIADTGVVVDEPSMVGVNTSTGEVEAIGIEAKRMLGRTPGTITAVRPMRDGVIADFKIAERMLTYFINKAHNRNLFVHPRIVIGVPGNITHVERRAVVDSAMRARASEVHLVEQAMMAAIGAGLPVSEPAGSMVVDVGGGTTDVAVISMSGVVYSKSVSVAGNAFDDAIIQHLKRKHNFLIGERTAERVKVELGAAKPLETPVSMEFKGRDLTRGVPAARQVTDRFAALSPGAWTRSCSLSGRHWSTRRPRSVATSATEVSSLLAVAPISRILTSASEKKSGCLSRWPRTPFIAWSTGPGGS